MSNLYDVTLSYNAFYYKTDVKIKGGLRLFHAFTNRHRETEVVLQQIVVSLSLFQTASRVLRMAMLHSRRFISLQKHEHTRLSILEKGHLKRPKNDRRHVPAAVSLRPNKGSFDDAVSKSHKEFALSCSWSQITKRPICLPALRQERRRRRRAVHSTSGLGLSV